MMRFIRSLFTRKRPFWPSINWHVAQEIRRVLNGEESQ